MPSLVCPSMVMGMSMRVLMTQVDGVLIICAEVPTTLMGMVDAAVGIKTAVNFHEKKNKLGTYCPPLAVFYDRCGVLTCDKCDVSSHTNLPDRRHTARHSVAWFTSTSTDGSDHSCPGATAGRSCAPSISATSATARRRC